MKDQHSEINRREFLQISAKLAVAATLINVNTSKLLSAPLQSEPNFIKHVTLNNGVKMPMVGFGTLYLNGEIGEKCVADAISAGYRLIDTATVYGNEAAVGGGIKKSGIDRKKLFITSKNWVDDYGYEKTKAAFELSLSKLGLEYLDLYLLHRPRGDVKGAWKALRELYKDGKIRAIGVSNFDTAQLKNIIQDGDIVPAVNQIETHAFFQQPEMYKVLKKYKIQMEAWSPFAQGRNNLFSNETLASIGKRHHKTNAQVSLRWLFQRGIVSIPRTSKVEHMKENLDIFDFKLSKAEMKTISKLDLNITQFPEWS